MSHSWAVLGGLSGEGGGAWKGISHERNSMNRKPEAGQSACVER